MPVGLLVPVVLVGWATACALTSWRPLGPIARIPALVASELPFLGAYLLVASLALALAQGDLGSVAGVTVAAVAVLVLLGLAVLVRRALRADAALGNVEPRRRWARILLAPLPGLRRDVVRTRNVRYREGRRGTLDVYCRRDRPTGAPVVVHFHGGGFQSGNKNREARPLIGHLTANGFVCVSAGYRLRPAVSHTDQVADVLSAIEWVKDNVADYGGDASRLVLVGSSAGAHLAFEALNEGTTGICGLVARYGYYGSLAPVRDLPPVLVIHGDHDLYVRPEWVRAFIERVRARPGTHVEYVELPGAHHDFDLYESIRSAAVSLAVQTFIERVIEN